MFIVSPNIQGNQSQKLSWGGGGGRGGYKARALQLLTHRYTHSVATTTLCRARVNITVMTGKTIHRFVVLERSYQMRWFIMGSRVNNN